MGRNSPTTSTLHPLSTYRSDTRPRLPYCIPNQKVRSCFSSSINATMAAFKPYTYFQCPCTDTTIPSYQLDAPSLNALPEEDEDDSDEGQAFDPRAPRANYSLYPLEHLLYCEDCHQIRCPKCVLDEIVTWYCPSCLFEIPSSTVKSEGNKYCTLCPLLCF